jgi:hypothetical protein
MGGVRQFRSVAAAHGKRKKVPTRPKRPEGFAVGVGRALRLAAKSARKTAWIHGTPIYVLQGGKIVAKRP